MMLDKVFQFLRKALMELGKEVEETCMSKVQKTIEILKFYENLNHLMIIRELRQYSVRMEFIRVHNQISRFKKINKQIFVDKAIKVPMTPENTNNEHQNNYQLQGDEFIDQVLGLNKEKEKGEKKLQKISQSPKFYENQSKQSKGTHNQVRSFIRLVRNFNPQFPSSEGQILSKLKKSLWERFISCSQQNKKLVLLAFGEFTSKIQPGEYAFADIYETTPEDLLSKAKAELRTEIIKWVRSMLEGQIEEYMKTHQLDKKIFIPYLNYCLKSLEQSTFETRYSADKNYKVEE